MECPTLCGATHTDVIRTGDDVEGQTGVRRRECPGCGWRFTTFERLSPESARELNAARLALHAIVPPAPA